MSEDVISPFARKPFYTARKHFLSLFLSSSKITEPGFSREFPNPLPRLDNTVTLQPPCGNIETTWRYTPV